MTDYNSLEEAFNRLALMTERDALAQQLAARDKRLAEAEAWLERAHPYTFEEFEELFSAIEAFLSPAEDKAND